MELMIVVFCIGLLILGTREEVLKNKNLYFGSGLYLLSAVLNIFALSEFDYSYVLPFTSLTYVWTLLISYFILKEKMTIKKVIGVSLIVFGAFLISIV